MAEDGGRNALIIDARRLVPEHRIGEGVALANGDRGQLHTVGDVANRVNAVAGGLVVGIDHNGTLLIDFDSGRFEAEANGVRRTPFCENNGISLDRIENGWEDGEWTTLGHPPRQEGGG